nr:hypothetical protein [Terribacillus saccharophilus]
MLNKPNITFHSFSQKNVSNLKSIRLQWGDSTKSLGSFIVADLSTDLAIDSGGDEEQKRLDKIFLKGNDIKYIIKTTKGIYKSEELNGYIEIYNLSSELMKSSLANPAELFAPAEELAVHPWICICWGNKLEREILENLLVKNTLQSGALLLGKKDSLYNYQELNNRRVMRFVINQYRKAVKIGSLTYIEFPVSATKPDIHIPRQFTEDFVEQYRSGWNISLENPEDIVCGFSLLSIRDGIKLRAYQHSMGVAGAGLVYAIPAVSSLPDILHREGEPPIPDDALDDFMEAIEGDKSPLSYLQAAICYHELHEFGAFWHSVSWGEDRILPDEDENQYDYSPVTDIADLKEIDFKLKTQELPESLFPRFYYDNSIPVISFYTINDVGQVKLIRYKHVFSTDGYTQTVTSEILGYGGPGKIF